MAARRLVALTALAGLASVGASCGVGGPSGMERIDPADVPRGLASTTTSTTTTTTTTTVVVTPPSTAVDDTTTTAAADTTTTIPSQLVPLWFPSGNRLRSTTRAATLPITAAQLVQLLIGGPPTDELGIGLRTVIPDDPTITSQMTVDVRDGVATVELPPELLDLISPPDQRLLAGQIVLTILASVPGVGQVTFTAEGEPYGVILGGGNRAEPGQRLTASDYQDLIAGIEPPPVSTLPPTTLAPALPDTTSAPGTAVASSP